MPLPPAITIRSAGTLRAVAEWVPPGAALLLSAPGAAGFLGAHAWRALVALAPGYPDALCCGDAAGDALAALREGCRLLVLDAACPAFTAVAGAAAEAGAVLLPARPAALELDVIDLRRPTGRSRLADWLAGRHDTAPPLR
ncbi:hypothetical protein [Falsiroseomonas sp.]|uniref:hypothetical protein n=1 Tax=Falsiroseomonas sp. TaxID=2870721 RepID=UPI00272008E7|nr:hypothetical protein [Falsiroseomonas sp.]MDO9501923.1 hypothetical protein [Falsiroseomonas sp.]